MGVEHHEQNERHGVPSSATLEAKRVQRVAHVAVAVIPARAPPTRYIRLRSFGQDATIAREVVRTTEGCADDRHPHPKIGGNESVAQENRR